jgi:hypothetical protein
LVAIIFSSCRTEISPFLLDADKTFAYWRRGVIAKEIYNFIYLESDIVSFLYESSCTAFLLDLVM